MHLNVLGTQTEKGAHLLNVNNADWLIQYLYPVGKCLYFIFQNLGVATFRHSRVTCDFLAKQRSFSFHLLSSYSLFLLGLLNVAPFPVEHVCCSPNSY